MTRITSPAVVSFHLEPVQPPSPVGLGRLAIAVAFRRPRLTSVWNNTSEACTASIKYDAVVPKIAHEPIQVIPGRIAEKMRSLSCISEAHTNPITAMSMLAAIPIPVGPVLPVQKPQKLRKTQISIVGLFK